LTTAQVAELVQVSERTLQRLMHDTPVDIEPAWVKLGRIVRRSPSQLDRWLLEMSEWQPTAGARSGRRRGRSPQPRTTNARRTAREGRSKSSGSLRRPGESLADLARRLTSEKAGPGER
jgi:hypothetical protein